MGAGRESGSSQGTAGQKGDEQQEQRAGAGAEPWRHRQMIYGGTAAAVFVLPFERWQGMMVRPGR